MKEEKNNSKIITNKNNLIIFANGGKQYLARINDSLYLEKIEQEVGEKIIFNEILFYKNKFGRPFLKNVSVEGIIEKQSRYKKIKVYRYKPKKNTRRRKGHRQSFTQVKILSIKNG